MPSTFRGNRITSIFGAGDGNRTNPIGPSKGVTARFQFNWSQIGVKFQVVAIQGRIVIFNVPHKLFGADSFRKFRVIHERNGCSLSRES